MSYPLHFFDEMVGETISPIYTILPLDEINENKLSEKIDDEGRKVLRTFRSEFYSFSDDSSRKIYFEKILKRLLILKNRLEQLTKDAQKTYILMGQSEAKVFPKLQNFYSLYNNIHSFICVILVEFDYTFNWVDKDNSIKYNIELLNEVELQNDFENLADLLNKGIPIPDDLIEAYSLEDNNVELFKIITPQSTLREKITQIEKVVSLFEGDSKMEFIEYVKKFIRKYIVLNKDTALRSFYRVTLNFLKGELNLIKEPKDKVGFILDFMLHTNLAPDLTILYIKEYLQLLQIKAEDKDVVKILAFFKDQLEKIRMVPRYQKYNISRIKVVEISTLDQAYIILNEYLESYGLLPKYNQQIPLDNIGKDKFAVDLSKKELGILLDLFYRAKVLTLPKTKTIRLISEVITLKNKKEITMKDLYNQLSGWEPEDKETESIRKILQKMVGVSINKPSQE